MVKILVLHGYGINSEEELALSFSLVGGDVKIVHLNDLIDRKYYLNDFDIFAIPGGFSFGDYIGSGRVLANKLRLNLFSDIEFFMASKKPIIGICNGFQVLVSLGLLPWTCKLESRSIALTHNYSGQFENRWVYLKINENSPCIWTKNIKEMYLPVRHAEGRLVCKDQTTFDCLASKNLWVMKYIDDQKKETERYPMNPNGSPLGITALTNETGLIFGLMPHPEAFWHPTNIPKYYQEERKEPEGLAIFKNAVEYIQSQKKQPL